MDSDNGFKRSRNIYQLVKSLDTPSILPIASTRKSTTVAKKPLTSTAAFVSHSSSNKSNPKNNLNNNLNNNNNNAANSEFSTAYDEGQIPCRIWHGSVKLSLKWDVPLTSFSRPQLHALLILFVTGLKLEKFPYNWIVKEGLSQLLDFVSSSRSSQLVYLKLTGVESRRVSLELRNALNHPAALNVLPHLGGLVEALDENSLDVILHCILTPLSKLATSLQSSNSSRGGHNNFSRSSNEPEFMIHFTKFKDALQGKSARLLALVKSKWPTFASDY